MRVFYFFLQTFYKSIHLALQKSFNSPQCRAGQWNHYVTIMVHFGSFVNEQLGGLSSSFNHILWRCCLGQHQQRICIGTGTTFQNKQIKCKYVRVFMMIFFFIFFYNILVLHITYIKVQLNAKDVCLHTNRKNQFLPLIGS